MPHHRINSMRHTGLIRLVLLLALAPAANAEQETLSAIDKRQALEWENYDNPFSIIPHRPSYILPLAYSDKPNAAPYEEANSDWAPQSGEIKFQFSFKVPLLENFLFGHGFLSFGYTQQSYWQAYNSSSSSPFRENNYEPEILLRFPIKERVLGFDWRSAGVAFNHQSNGRSEPLSRSWNRVMLEFVGERDNLYLSLKPWWRIPEDTGDDDNPDIHHYMGHFELNLLKKHSEHTYGLMLRNNLYRENNRGALQLDYTYPLNKRLRGYVQIFSGYGESLIDYDHYNNRIGIGVMLTNWL